MILSPIFSIPFNAKYLTAVFCSNRNDYYDYLAQADKYTDDGLVAWAGYMLKGLKTEVEKIDKLLDYNYLLSTILLPSLKDALDHSYITDVEYAVLKVAFEKGEFQASDIKSVLGTSSSDTSRLISKLRSQRMVMPVRPNTRKYAPSFSNGLLLRSILSVLDINGFLPNNK